MIYQKVPPEVKIKEVKPIYTPFKCVICNGFGTVSNRGITCHACNGDGYLKIPVEEVENGS